jgi:hypothetical protein
VEIFQQKIEQNTWWRDRWRMYHKTKGSVQEQRQPKERKKIGTEKQYKKLVILRSKLTYNSRGCTQDTYLHWKSGQGHCCLRKVGITTTTTLVVISVDCTEASQSAATSKTGVELCTQLVWTCREFLNLVSLTYGFEARGNDCLYSRKLLRYRSGNVDILETPN